MQYIIIMSKIKTLLKTYKTKGLFGIKNLIKDKFFPHKVKPIKKFDLFLKHFTGKRGIEIGGPSGVFSEDIPIYQVMASLDGCNFSSKTIWEGQLVEGDNYNFFDSKKGYQYICEASDLKEVPSEKYDFLVSSHCLEHCANTLKTIKEWLRVIKVGGAILLVLPDKKNTFDHNRSITKFNHLLEDYELNIDEHDLTHLPEILLQHDLNLDLMAGTLEQFQNRSVDNFSNRCLHHHVFNFDLLKQIFEYNNVEIKNISYADPYHQIILGIKK